MQVEGVTEDQGRECGEVVKLGLAGVEATFAAMAHADGAKLAALAATFPTLAARGATDVADFKEIAAAPAGSCGGAAREAARFCLLVWDGSLGKLDGDYRFCPRRAWASWDGAHRAAWQAWAASP